ncbi:hypothetical protein SK128_026539 [Halocaridina rubra]|uniref:SAP domain-containing protein n=1 Tax=Halocaridina rubra TaxID=373956 RepID=A0AAN8XK46_HALRR
MDEAQIAKMKVADLKRELKARGLPVTGNKNELVERLQEALSTGVGISGSMDDEEFDEEEILGGAMDSSQLTPQEEEAALRGSAVKLKKGATPAAKSPLKKPVRPAPKAAATPTPAPAKETASPTKKPIIAVAVADKDQENEPPKKIAKIEETPAEKTPMEKRAERFGVPMNDDAKKQARAARFGVLTNGTTKSTTKLTPFTGTVDMDKLKARAERFGEVVSKSLTKVEELEKKKQRMERFSSSDSKTTDAASTESAKAARAARFGVADKAAAE